MKGKYMLPKHKLRLLLCMFGLICLVTLTDEPHQHAELVKTLAANRPVSFKAPVAPVTAAPVPDTTTTTSAPPAPTTTEPQAVTEPPPPPPSTEPLAPPDTEQVVEEVAPEPEYQGGSGVWYELAGCESGGNWSINTGNGYFGGLQMDMQFWHSYGGDEFASRPDLASDSSQITVATRARDSGRGYRPWPGCARQLGLI